MYQVRFDNRSKSLASPRPSRSRRRTTGGGSPSSEALDSSNNPVVLAPDQRPPSVVRSVPEQRSHVDPYLQGHSPATVGSEALSEGQLSNASPGYSGFGNVPPHRPAASHPSGMLDAQYNDVSSNRLHDFSSVGGHEPHWAGGVAHQTSGVAPSSVDTHSNVALQQACLLRYYIEEIAPWVKKAHPKFHLTRKAN